MPEYQKKPFSHHTFARKRRSDAISKSIPVIMNLTQVSESEAGHGTIARAAGEHGLTQAKALPRTSILEDKVTNERNRVPPEGVAFVNISSRS